MLPSNISLAYLDTKPEVIALSSNGIHFLCGPPGKPEPKELTSNGLVVQWTQPEYGCPSLARYTLYYQKKCSETNPTSEWKKLELNSQEAEICVPDLNDGDTYVFKICTMSDVGTLQYSDESDPIVISADRISTDSILLANEQIAFSYADPDTVAHQLSRRGLISKESEAQISLASTPSKEVTLLLTAIKHQMANEPQNFPHFLNAISEAKVSLLQPSDIEETLLTSYYDFVYQQYLRFLYASLDKKQTSPNQWPPSATKKFFRLAMIKSAKVRIYRIH